MNLYAYAGNNPVAFADPFGLCPPIKSCLGKLKRAAQWVHDNVPEEVVLGVGVALLAMAEDGRADPLEVRQLRNSVAAGAAAGGSRLRPDPRAQGAHSTFRASGGRVTAYVTWHPTTNALDPKPWTPTKRVQVTGSPHFNKALQQFIATPHVHDEAAPGGVRPAARDEIPE